MNWALLTEAVLEHRKSKKLTVREADEESGVSYVAISRVERGMTCSVVTFERLCKWMEADPEDFWV